MMMMKIPPSTVSVNEISIYSLSTPSQPLCYFQVGDPVILPLQLSFQARYRKVASVLGHAMLIARNDSVC